MLRIKLVKSPIGNNLRNRRTVAALGLRKVHQVVEQPDNPSIRGMIHHVQHMVTFEVVEGEVQSKATKKAAKSESKPATAAKAAPKKVAKASVEDASQPEAAAEKPKRAPAKKKTEEKA